MNTLSKGLIYIAMLSAPLAAMAQSNNAKPLTRAEVRQQLIDAENAGYKPAASDPYYPADIQAAEQRVEESHQVAANGANASPEHTGYGASPESTSNSGGIHTRALPPTYFGQ
jgi:hypothetical protein